MDATKPTEAFRTALIGAGGFGTHTLAALCQLSGVRVVGVGDQDSAAASAAAAEANCPAYTDPRRLLVETKPQALFAALPPGPAGDIARLASQRGIHVWRETPLGRTLEEGVELWRMMEQAHLCLAIGTQRRFMGGYRAAKRWIDKIGKISLADCHYYFNIGPIGSWRGDRAAGGGSLLTLGYHVFDLAVWLMGLPETVYCQAQTAGRHASPEPVYDTDDSACCLLGYPGKATVMISVSRRHHPASEGIALYGENGSILAEPGRCLLRDRDGAVIDQFQEECLPLTVFGRQVQSFIQAVQAGGGMYECSGLENLLTLSTIDAAYLSDRTGQPESPADLLRSFDIQPADCLTLAPKID